MATVIPKLSSPATSTTSATTDEAKRLDMRESLPHVADFKVMHGGHASTAKKITLVDHPAAQHAFTALRNKNTAAEEFRACCNQLLLVLSLEAIRTMPVREESVDTHSSTHNGKVFAKPIVVLSVTRDGLGLVHDLAKSLIDIQVGSISLNPGSESRRPEPRMHIFNAPVLSDARILLFDPIVATGLSATLALNFLRRSGAPDVSLVSFLFSSQGRDRIQASFPDLPVWTTAVDDEWDSKRGPLPGIWNFSERLYG